MSPGQPTRVDAATGINGPPVSNWLDRRHDTAEWAGVRQVMATRSVISGRGTYDHARPPVQATCGHHRLTVHLLDASP